MTSRRRSVRAMSACERDTPSKQARTSEDEGYSVVALRIVTHTKSVIQSMIGSVELDPREPEVAAALVPGDKTLFIMKLMGGRISLRVNLDETLETLKYRVMNREGIPPDQQRLIFNGRQLVDGKKLNEQGITGDEFTVHMVLRLRGGMHDPTSGREDFSPNAAIPMQMHLENDTYVHLMLYETMIATDVIHAVNVAILRHLRERVSPQQYESRLAAMIEGKCVCVAGEPLKFPARDEKRTLAGIGVTKSLPYGRRMVTLERIVV